MGILADCVKKDRKKIRAKDFHVQQQQQVVLKIVRVLNCKSVKLDKWLTS